MPEIGADNDTGRLRMALVRCPEQELDCIADEGAEAVLWNSCPNPELARLQHARLTSFLEQQGVKVINLPVAISYPNLCFTRDHVILLPEACLLSSFAHECRRGEEVEAARALHELGIKTEQQGSCGPFEGGDFLLAENRVMLAGVSGRTTREAVDALATIFIRRGVRAVVPIPIPPTALHLDCCILPIGNRKLICAVPLPDETQFTLENVLGFQIIHVPFSWAQEKHLGLNALFLNEQLALLSKSAPSGLVKLLSGNGVEVKAIDVSEFEKGGGSVHCLVAPISRARATIRPKPV